MSRRTGTADLPLHGGRAPRWLFERMERLAPAVVEAIVLEAGPGEVLRRLSDPWWFQAFGCVLGFDWHSSGVTTTVCGALKSGLAGREGDTGIAVAGGKGRASRRTPDELREQASRAGADGETLVHISRITAKVDSSAVQDGFQVYHHAFFHTEDGAWAVVQQGMREADGSARRYHWLGEGVESLVREPHAAVCADRRGGAVLNLVAEESEGARRASSEIAREDPDRVMREWDALRGQPSLFGPRSPGASPVRSGRGNRPPAARTAEADGPRASLRMPHRHHVVEAEDVDPRQLRKVLLSTYESGPEDFEGLLGVRGVGARSLRALALLSEVVYGEPASLRDPARFSFAHGGKDGHPYPVDRETYDRSIHLLREAVDRAKVARTEGVKALKRLARWEEEAGSATPP
ncbi:MAG: DUF763 domain-containing protein [Gemmatimonadetes bacterium]|nr:DUF763 domain-containing protein [Gemmatimonadota bacterium]NIR77142.1 DUF763 domain-containing protein [Gemmatimonadota bacterium]NIT85657.1 DUF763 domain-containing protein [Gemmatimonadota bacterium]NIU29489.1 DUF763 domain-containing protein [Gemmatimonadota bacterium]NIU34543.1 DUF763 domain-containing protein [Gemmatimonadota bacterium]